MRGSNLPSLLLLVALGAAACEDDGTSETSAPPSDAGTEEAGSFDCPLCPDPDEPRVHYVSQDPNDCIGIVLECTPEQNGFQSQCGCGCVDKGEALCPEPCDPAITWVSTDPASCDTEPPECPLNEIGFSNSGGCGCTQPGS